MPRSISSMTFWKVWSVSLMLVAMTLTPTPKFNFDQGMLAVEYMFEFWLGPWAWMKGEA